MMAPQPLTVAKSRRMGYLLSVKRRIASLKKVCDEPEKQERDEVVRDRGSQWTSTDSTDLIGWGQIEDREAEQGTDWRFPPQDARGGTN